MCVVVHLLRGKRGIEQLGGGQLLGQPLGRREVRNPPQLHHESADIPNNRSDIICYRRFLFLATSRMSVTATTCSPATPTDTALRLYDGCPSVSGSQLLASQAPDFYWYGDYVTD